MDVDEDIGGREEEKVEAEEEERVLDAWRLPVSLSMSDVR